MIEKLKNKTINLFKKNKIAIVLIILLLFLGIVIYNLCFDNDSDIKSVKKILKRDYFNVECLNSICSGFIAEKGEKLGKSIVEIYNFEGKKIGSYKEKYNPKSKINKKPYDTSNDYFLIKNINVKNAEIDSYSIYSKNGKELYNTKNELEIINDKYILMYEKTNEETNYSIINEKGEKYFSNIKNIEKYANNEIILLNIGNDTILLNKNMKKILDDYSVKYEKSGDGFLILKNLKNDVYSYFDIKKSKIVGDNFENYKIEEHNIIITRTKMSTKEKYLLSSDGKQTKIEDKFVQVDEVNKIKKKIDLSKYYLYSNSVYTSKQKIVLVDNLIDKTFGVLNVDKNKYTMIYDYDANKNNFKSIINNISSNDNKTYFQISCDINSCKNTKNLIYNINDKKEIYKTSNTEKIIQNFVQYEDNYKVIKYSMNSSDINYKGMYVLYDDKNNELFKSSNEIVVLDKNIIFGENNDDSFILFKISNSKKLNNDETLAVKIIVSEKEFYKYVSDNNEIIIVDSKGKQIIKTKENSYLEYGDDNIIYLKENNINIYNVKNKKTSSYKLEKNETINDKFGNIIPPYKNALFINNNNEKYIKIISPNGKVIKNIKKSEISSIGITKNNNIYIITKTKNKNNNYGLYIAK